MFMGPKRKSDIFPNNDDSCSRFLGFENKFLPRGAHIVFLQLDEKYKKNMVEKLINVTQYIKQRHKAICKVFYRIPSDW